MHLLSIDDLSKEEINEIFEIADDVGAGKEEITIKPDSILALLFQKSSLKTRLALEVAISRLGGRALYLDFENRTLASYAQVLSTYANFIAARLPSQDSLAKFAELCSVPVINAGTELEHPILALSILYLLRRQIGISRKRKLAIVGNPGLGSVNSLMLGAAKLGLSVAIASPQAFSVNPLYLVKAREHGVVDLFNNVAEAVENTDAVYVDTFIPEESSAEKQEMEKLDLGVLKESEKFIICNEEKCKELAANANVQESQSRLLVSQAIILFLSEKNI